jgi:hypothetical protein
VHVPAIRWIALNCPLAVEFYFDRAKFARGALEGIADAFAERKRAQLPPVLHIHLTRCNLGPADMGKLAHADIGAKKVSLGGNPLGDDGAYELADGIMRSRLGSFDYLGVSNCSISPLGACALARALAPCPELETIVFFGNPHGAHRMLEQEFSAARRRRAQAIAASSRADMGSADRPTQAALKPVRIMGDADSDLIEACRVVELVDECPDGRSATDVRTFPGSCDSDSSALCV